MSTQKRSRREFLGTLAGSMAASLPLLEKSQARAAAGEMTYRTLGRSGEKVSMIGLGGYHIGVPRDEQESTRIDREDHVWIRCTSEGEEPGFRRVTHKFALRP